MRVKSRVLARILRKKLSAADLALLRPGPAAVSEALYDLLLERLIRRAASLERALP